MQSDTNRCKAFSFSSGFYDISILLATIILTWHGLNCDHDGTLSPFHCTSVRIDDTVVAPMS